LHNAAGEREGFPREDLYNVYWRGSEEESSFGNIKFRGGIAGKRKRTNLDQDSRGGMES